MWPTGLGFERYYGFLNGETNQWTPNLVRDQYPRRAPGRRPTRATTSTPTWPTRPIRQLRDLRLHNPTVRSSSGTPPRAPHAPHQAPPEWIDRYRGRFDDGWDVWRERTLDRQQAARRRPRRHRCSPIGPTWVEAWDDVDADRRRLYTRMMEVFAGFLSHADHQIGRVLDEIEATGQARRHRRRAALRQRLLGRGRPQRQLEPARPLHLNDEADDLDDELAHLDDLGGFRSSGHYPWGWALAGNTPFQRWKRYTFEGGVRDPLIISWPGTSPIRAACATSTATRSTCCRRCSTCSASTAPAELRWRATAVARRRVASRTLLEDAGGARGPHQPVLRVLGQPGHLRRRLEGGHQPRQPAHRCRARRHRGVLDVRRRPVAPLRHPHRLHRVHTTSPPSTPRRLAELDSALAPGGRAQRRAARSTTAATTASPSSTCPGCTSRRRTSCARATRSTSRTPRCSWAGSAWWLASANRLATGVLRCALRTGRLDGGLGVVPPRRPAHLDPQLERGGASGGRPPSMARPTSC